jgi:hypothetical protein
MFYPILLALWAAFFAGPHGTATMDVPQNLQIPSKINRNTTYFGDYLLRFEKHKAAAAPEKLYLHLDRTLFQPGETLWFCAYVRNAGNLEASQQSQILIVELMDTRGGTMARKEILALNGVAAGEFDFDAHLPGGRYKIKAYTNWMRNRNEVFERDITLQKVVLPNINLKLEFERKALGAGEVAIARFDAQTIDNKPLANHKIDFTASIAGLEVSQGQVTTDATGRAYVRFNLPEKLHSSDGLLNLRLEHNGQQEAISRPIPIVLNRISLQFFPEGGDALAGVSTRMAFKALNEFGKPADVEGFIENAQGQQVATFRSFHDGMGAFDFVPKPGERYVAQVTKPFLSAEKFKLPEVKTEGVRLQLQKRDASYLTFELAGHSSKKLLLVGTQRDNLFFFKEIDLKMPALQVLVPIADLPIGIAQFTLLNEDEQALAERLVFVGRDRGLQIELKTDKSEYLPREAVHLNIQVKDHAGKPVQGKFSLAVSDEKLLSFADDKQGHLLASLLLEQDVKGKIEEPNFYFDASEPKSAQALDYLLMTQGWRRFAWMDILKSEASVAQFMPQRAVLEGVMYRKDGKPSWGGTVALFPNGPSVKTTKNGFFSFKNVDINHYSHLRYGNGKLYGMSQYDTDIVLNMGERALNRGWHHSFQSSGTAGTSVLIGNISDGQEALIGATVKVMKGQEFVRGSVTDYDGNYRILVPPGVYEVEFSYTGYTKQKITGIQVEDGKNTHLNVGMANAATLHEVQIISYKIPRIEQDKTSSGQTLTSDQIKNLPTRKVNTIVATTVGASSIDGGDVNIKGARSGNVDYYIDGIRVVSPNAHESKRSSKPEWSSAVRRFSVAREFYVPPYTAQESSVQRSDFRSTIYWNPNITTNANGRAEVNFYTSDAITNFRATLEGISDKGTVGRTEHKFFAQKPLSIAVKAPASVISGDVLQLQIALTNKTKYATGGHLNLSLPEHFKASAENAPKSGESILIPPGETKVINAEYTIGLTTSDQSTISIQFMADEAMLDAYETNIRTLHRGFPVRMMAAGKAAQNRFDIRLSAPVEGTVEATLTAYPSTLDDILKGMERMLRQPNGCFEQVSSSNYPNLLVLDLLRETGALRPEVESRALQYLEEGYKKLTGYESKTGGFDWYGRDPGHEGLTAYGLLQFTDMARVFPVDKSMVERTTTWLQSRRDLEGGWKINPNLHGWENNEVMGAYICWAVAEAGMGAQFKTEIEQSYKQAAQSENAYILALMANTLAAMQDPRAATLVEKLLPKQEAQGSWIGNAPAVFRSQGQALRVETTALTALVLMKLGIHETLTEQAMEFIAKSKNEYGFGNTQSTVLALKTLVEYAKKNKQRENTGLMVVQVDGKRVQEETFSNSQQNRLEIKGLERFFSNENPQVEVFFEGNNVKIPFDMEIKYATRTPQNAANCPLSFKTELSQTKLRVGETVRLLTTLQNETALSQASPLVVLGIPAGLSLQVWQLKKLVEEKHCDFYELWDGYVVFHFEQLGPNESRQLALDLRAEVAGKFEAPASRAYLYYENEQRVWSKPARVEIGR